MRPINKRSGLELFLHQAYVSGWFSWGCREGFEVMFESWNSSESALPYRGIQAVTEVSITEVERIFTNLKVQSSFSK